MSLVPIQAPITLLTNAPMNDPIVYLNGDMTPLSEARIPVLDRGFIFGDGVYEVIPMYARKPFRGTHHIARLFRSLGTIGITNPHSEAEWLALIDRVVQANDLSDQIVYIQVTRGVAKRGACVTMQDKRWLNCQIKSTSLLGNVLAAQYAAEHEVAEAIQFRDGFLSEASSSNVWIVKDGKLSAPPKDNLILEGIRYGLIEELCKSQGIVFEARRITQEEVFAADEVLLSSATKEVLPVVTIDDKSVGNGKPGPVFAKLYAAYQDAKAALS